jgi:RHS repeat-associated protein
MRPQSASTLFAGLFSLAVLLMSPVTSPGQTSAARPDRGSSSSSSYSVSDIENINLQNGNVNLKIPLASLPAMAGGKLSWTISATYNSKLWNITRSEADADDNQYRPYVIDTPQIGDYTGWQITGQYILSLRYAQEDYDYLIPPPNAIPETEYYLRLNYNWYRVVLTMPDGSEHEFRPVDYSPYSAGDTFLHGYYKENPYQNGTMRYYSFDGSHLSLKFTSLADWTVYMPDGTKIIQTTDGVQRIQDTNGNKIKIYSDGNGTHYQDEQTGREIRYFYNPSGNGGQGQGQVWYQTVGGTWMHVDINFGFTYIQGQVYKVKDWMPGAFNSCQRFNEINQEIQVVREIVLPQTEPGVTRKFSFNYNSDATEIASNPFVRFTCSDPSQTYTRTASKGWGELSQIITPSNAVVDYSYSMDAFHSPLLIDNLAEASVTQKKITHDGTTDTWTYAINSTTGTVTNPDGSTVSENKYSHSPGFAYSYSKAGLVFRTTKPFTRIERHWIDLQFSGASTLSPGGTVNINPVVDVEYTTLLDASNNPLKMSAEAYQYDYNGNVLQVIEYDWFDPALVSRDANGVPTGVPGSATVLRVTNNSYYNPATTSTSGNVYAKRSLSTGTPLIVNAVQQTTIGPSVTQFSYDGQYYGAAPTSGNLTAVSKLDDRGDSNPGNNVWLTVSNTYDAYGNLTTTTDARGKVTQYFYDDALHAMPTRVVVDPQNGTGQLTTTTAYDFYSGVVTSTSDVNGQASTTDYTNHLLGTVDPYGRPGTVISPTLTVNGTPQHLRVKHFYQDNARKSVITSDLNTENDGLVKHETLADQLGRAIETRQYETGTAYIAVKRVYDAMSRVSQVSNPYRPGTTPVWTTTGYDASGRVLSVTTPESAVVSSSYYSNQVTTTDQKGRSRRSLVDALGRVTQVIEDPNGLAYQTNYSYDMLGGLRIVTQGTQSRYFMYDSLARLLRVRIPEQAANAALAITDPVSGNSQWTLGYTYDNNANVSTKTDARGVTTTYTYDGINRITVVNYSDGTPAIQRYYDGATNGKGRLWLSYSGTSHTANDSYDAMGRTLSQRQHFYSGGSWGAAYTTTRAYDLAGNVIAQTYPSGRTVNYTYDQAGRASGFAGNLGGSVTRTYASAISYDEWNGIAREQFGTNTPLYHKEHRNIRGQLYDVRLSTVNDDFNWNRGAIVNYYNLSNYGFGTSGTDNNGNLLVQQSWVPDDDAISGSSYMQQNYDYDALNRLKSVGEYLNGTTNTGGQDYSYDRFGNRTITGWGAGINSQPFAADANTNRLGVPSGMSGVMQYDANGNLVNDTYSGAGARSYDAENRMISATNNGSQQSVYTYDADGSRVRRNSFNQETWQVYGMEGELLAEYAANAAPSTPQKEYGYRNGQLLVTAAQPLRTNVALASNGGVATASSSYTPTAYTAVEANNGERKGVTYWNDAAPANTFPDWLQIVFSGSKTIDEVDLFMVQDNYANPSEPTENMTFTSYGLTAFEVQYWNGSAWVNVPGGSVTGNDKVWKKLTFSAITTTKIRVLSSAAPDGYSRVTEVEAWQGAGGGSSGADIRWLVTDQVGTPRIIADQTGSLAGITRHDYLPFGEELYAGTGSRTAQKGYVADNVRQHFTDYERDTETGLDYAGARYYNSIHGRFTSVDPLLSSSNVLNPQTWNKYAYVNNRPLTRIDPSGLFDWADSLGGSASDKELEKNLCATDVCTDKERAAGKRSKAEVDRIKQERSKVIAAINMLQSLLTVEAYIGNLNSDESQRLKAAIGALGNPNDHNGVTINSSVELNQGVFETRHYKNGLSAIFLPTGGIQGISFHLGLVHEGQHVQDFNVWYNKGSKNRGQDMSEFEYEVRGFETEGIAAKARGLTIYPMAGNREAKEMLWDKSWGAADVPIMRRNGAKYRVTRDYPPLSETNQGGLKFGKKIK